MVPRTASRARTFRMVSAGAPLPPRIAPNLPLDVSVPGYPGPGGRPPGDPGPGGRPPGDPGPGGRPPGAALPREADGVVGSDPVDGFEDTPFYRAGPRGIAPHELAPSAARGVEADHDGCDVGYGYRLGPVLGRGGTAVVHQASHPELGNALALKVIVDERLHGELAIDAIVEHARIIASFRTPYVVRTLDAGQLPSGEPFVVMERLHGEALADHVRQNGALPIDEAIRLAVQICFGLAEAHARGIVHGDIKPGNLTRMPSAGGSAYVKIIDFGAAVPSPESPDRKLVTGSPGYAAPEQLDPRGKVDGRADIWAIGVVLYELVTGRRAYDVDSLAAAWAAARRPLPPMTSPHGPVPAALADVVAGCLALDPEERFRDVEELAGALTEIAAKGAAAARTSPSIVRRARAAVTRRRSERAALSLPRALPHGVSPDARLPPASSRRGKRSASSVGYGLRLLVLGPLCALLAMALVRLVLVGS